VHVCNDGDVTYEWDEQAAKEAADYPVSAPDTDVLRRQCTRKAADLGADGVRSHTLCFSVTAWDQPPGLPDGVSRVGRISRGDVLDIGQQVRARARPATDLFVASFIWGWGTVGYGPRRLCDVRAAAGNKLEPSLQRVLDAVNTDPASPDPIAGYACLYGGDDDRDRATPGQEPWSRLHGFGPAFFTKFLYFSTPGALILDNRLANAVHKLSQLPHLVTAHQQSLAWTPYRYAIYLHWMTQTAQTVGVEPELLELTLFQPPGDLTDENGAAD
jgi:8-oxoguanine DNA glycosylase-like protein